MMGLRETRCLELNAMSLGVDEETLMENAGKAVAKIISERYENKKVVVVCGTGNNGGDGFVAARLLKNSSVILAKSPEFIKTDLAKKKYREWGGEGLVYGSKDDLAKAEVIVDALLGTGVAGDLRPPYDDIVDAMNNSDANIVSIDVPSNLWGSKRVNPKITITFHHKKEGMNGNSGEIVVADIGIPQNASLYTGPGEFAFFPLSKKDAHKGQMGHVLVIGGGPFPGAPVLSAIAAMKVGADLVTLLVPENSARFASNHPELIVKELPSSNRIEMSALERITEEMNKCDVVLLGPGVGTLRDTTDTLRTTINSSSKPMVIDADGLKALRGHIDILKNKKGIVTPHAGEFEFITQEKLSPGIENHTKAACYLSNLTGMTVILKSAIDVIAQNDSYRLNRTGCPAMAVGGTGDVLAGLCAGLMARGMDPFKAGRLGAYISGCCGEMAFRRYSYSMGPIEVLKYVPDVLKSGLSRV
ncbi:MAG TPA: NAD(P)H-hydrate dehydratase [Euryarchaeota archaeon]|nr:NAD(P)H-hydrate dehydratase [Euryarchaeota archaeon]